MWTVDTWCTVLSPHTPGCDRPHYPSWRSCLPSITACKQWWIQQQNRFAFVCISCFSVAFCSENWLTESGRNILFLLHVSWLADEEWSLQLGALWRGTGYAADSYYCIFYIFSVWFGWIPVNWAICLFWHKITWRHSLFNFRWLLHKRFKILLH